MSVLIDLNSHTETKPCQPALAAWNRAPSQPEKSFLYDLVGAKEEDSFVFTSSGAEAIQHVLWSVFLERARKEGRGHFLTGSFEDAPLLLGMKRLEELGCFIKTADEPAQLAELINPRTALVSFSLAQGLTGKISSLDSLREACRANGVLLHVDASYAIGKVPVDLESFDYLTFSGNCIHSVNSSGALFAQKEAPLAPFILGKEEDLSSLAALNVAAQQANLFMTRMGLETARLRNHFEYSLLKEIEGSALLYSDELRLPNVSLLSFPRVHQEALLYALRRRNVRATLGGGKHTYLHRLLSASGFDARTAASAISFSLSRQTTAEEIDEAVKRIVQAFNSLKPCASHL